MLRFELIKIGVSLLLFSLTFSIQADSLTGLNSLRISSENYDSENCGASTQKLKDEMRYWLGKDLKLVPNDAFPACYAYLQPIVRATSPRRYCYGNITFSIRCPGTLVIEANGKTNFGVFSIYSDGESFFSPENQMSGYKEEIVQDLIKLFIVEWRNANQ